jgi:putative nucleotidyltransferase with HDIG domain
MIDKQVQEDWIPTMPLVYVKFQEVVKNPESAFKDFADVIGGDTSLTSRLLKIVNSPFYGFEGKIETIPHALYIVGTEELHDMVLATSVINVFKGYLKDLIDMEAFWRHSIACALAAKEIAGYMEPAQHENLYVAGLIHDIGSLVIYNKMPDISAGVLKESEKHKIPQHIVEKKAFGYDHSVVGERILTSWNIPQRLIESVTYHHDPLRAPNYHLEAAIIHRADVLAHELDLGNSGSSIAPNLNPEVDALLGISEEQLEEIKVEVCNQFEETVSLLLPN